NCGNFSDDDNDFFYDCSDPDCFSDPVCIDTDFDGWPDIYDNCPLVENGFQEDSDFNGIGDACQDGDSDGALDTVDNCLEVANPDQADTDLDLIGNVCDPTESRCNNGTDDDDDDLIDCEDPDCAKAQVCQPLPDSDEDGVPNATDNCPDDANPDQADNDGDGAGNICDGSPDGPPDTGGDSNIATGDVGGGGCALNSNAAEAPGALLFLTMLGTCSLVWRIRRQSTAVINRFPARR
ncbi:MAG: thrombospondin type 3 repeat-containing protein, partial [Deltaproteobacteria bacterium]|nr:thrombospondin type 3 repeat-containing protein [Deltaproteobacteria bacterium]